MAGPPAALVAASCTQSHDHLHEGDNALLKEHARFFAACLSLGVVVAFVLALLSTKPPPITLATLVNQTHDELVVLIDPANCDITPRLIAGLNGFESRTGVRPRAILTSLPDVSDREYVISLFDFSFPVAFDYDGAWAHALASSGIRRNAVVLSRSGRVPGSCESTPLVRVGPVFTRGVDHVPFAFGPES